MDYPNSSVLLLLIACVLLLIAHRLAALRRKELKVLVMYWKNREEAFQQELERWRFNHGKQHSPEALGEFKCDWCGKRYIGGFPPRIVHGKKVCAACDLERIEQNKDWMAPLTEIEQSQPSNVIIDTRIGNKSPRCPCGSSTCICEILEILDQGREQ